MFSIPITGYIFPSGYNECAGEPCTEANSLQGGSSLMTDDCQEEESGKEREDLLKVFRIIQPVACQRHNHHQPFSFEQFDEIVRATLKRNVGEKVLGQFLFLGMLKAEWRQETLYIAMKEDQMLSLINQKEREDHLRMTLGRFQHAVPQKSLPVRPKGPQERSAKSLLEESRYLFQRQAAIDKEKCETEPITEKGYEGLLAKVQRKKAHQQELQMFASVEEEREEKF